MTNQPTEPDVSVHVPVSTKVTSPHELWSRALYGACAAGLVVAALVVAGKGETEAAVIIGLFAGGAAWKASRDKIVR